MFLYLCTFICRYDTFPFPESDVLNDVFNFLITSQSRAKKEWTNARIYVIVLQNYLQFYEVVPENDLTETDRSSFIERVFSDQLYQTWAQEVMYTDKFDQLKSS